MVLLGVARGSCWGVCVCVGDPNCWVNTPPCTTPPPSADPSGRTPTPALNFFLPEVSLSLFTLGLTSWQRIQPFSRTLVLVNSQQAFALYCGGVDFSFRGVSLSLGGSVSFHKPVFFSPTWVHLGNGCFTPPKPSLVKSLAFTAFLPFDNQYITFSLDYFFFFSNAGSENSLCVYIQLFYQLSINLLPIIFFFLLPPACVYPQFSLLLLHILFFSIVFYPTPPALSLSPHHFHVFFSYEYSF